MRHALFGCLLYYFHSPIVGIFIVWVCIMLVSFSHCCGDIVQVFAAKPQLDDDFSEEDFLSSACSSHQGSVCSIDAYSPSADSISQGSGGGGRSYRRRSSSCTSETTKFREKLQSLSKSAELQEHLVTESPRERELEEEGMKEEVDKATEERERLNVQDYTDYPSDSEQTNNNSNASNNKERSQAAGRKEIASLDRSSGKRTTLNVSEKVAERSSSAVTPTSIYSAGYDL